MTWSWGWEQGLTINRHEKTFSSDENVIILDYGDGVQLYTFTTNHQFQYFLKRKFLRPVELCHFILRNSLGFWFHSHQEEYGNMQLHIPQSTFKTVISNGPT